MFDFCCFKRNTKKGVKSLEAYNKDYKPLQKISEPKEQGSSKLNRSLQNNHVLASIPMDISSFNLNRYSKGLLQSHAKKTILKSDYDEIIKKYEGIDKKWQDTNFPPNDKSWGDPQQKVKWARVTDIVPNAKFVQNNFTPFDIIQGNQIGDCYFLSSVAGLAEQPKRISAIFPSTQMNKNGIYMARIMHKGVFQQVIVDDFFPISQETGRLLSCKPAGGNEIWVMVLEKCWAKLYGSYKAIEGGFPDEVLRAISSAPTFNFSIEQSTLPSLWNRIIYAEENEYVMCAGSIAFEKIQTQKQQQFTDKGLVSGHAYTVLGACEIAGQTREEPYRLVKLRNPWGEGFDEWKGANDDYDREFWEQVDEETKQKIGYDRNKKDGVFFMFWSDFTKYFNIIDFCNYQDNAHYCYFEEIFSHCTPIYYDFETEGGTSTFILSQTSKREREKTEKSNNIRLRDPTLVLARLDSGNVQYIKSISLIAENMCLQCKGLKPGKYVLVAFLDSDEVKQIEGTVSVYTKSHVSFSRAKNYDYQFLSKIFINHASTNPKLNTITQNPFDWSCDGFIEDSGFGYSVAHLDPKSTKQLKLEFYESKYLRSPYDLLLNYRGKGNFTLICNKGEEVAVVAKKYSWYGRSIIRNRNYGTTSIEIIEP